MSTSESGESISIRDATPDDVAVLASIRHGEAVHRDRVFLGGQSLGGFGSYQWCPRFSDKIAGGVLCAGSWRVINWRCMIGKPLFIVHGLHDSQPGGRPRYTDVFFARSAHKLLEEAGWKDTDGDGVRDKDGKPFKFAFMIPASSVNSAKMATKMKAPGAEA